MVHVLNYLIVDTPDWDIDYYRDLMATNTNNSHLEIGGELEWSFRDRRIIGSRSTYLYLGVF